ncbi:hypothetical protein ACFYO2_42510 [Streptomyces sp. NPDC006602]
MDGETRLVSNLPIGPTDNTCLAGPQLGQDAETLYETMRKTYVGQ